MNAVEIEQTVSELAEQPFDRAEFQFQFGVFLRATRLADHPCLDIILAA